MIIQIMLATFLIGLVFYVLTNTKKPNNTQKYPHEDKLPIIDFDDEILSFMSDVVGKQLNYADKYSAKYLIFFRYRHTDMFGTKQLDCESVENRCYLKEDKDNNKYISITTTKNYGSPTWSNNEMTYNYPMITKSYQCRVDEFANLWPEIRDTLFIIETKSENNTKRVQDERMTYWTESKHGHRID